MIDPACLLSFVTVVDSGSDLVTTDDRKRTFATWNLRAEMRF